MNAASARKKRYRLKQIKKGLCIKCTNPTWEGRRTCKRHTLHLRAVAQRPKSREKRLVRLKLRDRRKKPKMSQEELEDLKFSKISRFGV